MGSHLIEYLPIVHGLLIYSPLINEQQEGVIIYDIRYYEELLLRINLGGSNLKKGGDSAVR